MVENCKPLMNDQQSVNTIVDCPVSCDDFGSFFLHAYLCNVCLGVQRSANGRLTGGCLRS